MIQTIIDYLNLRVETLGRIAHLYGITEKRKRSGDDAAMPYAYVGAGQFEPVDIDNGNAGWWRPRSGFTMEPVEVIGRAVKQQRASYPLRFVAVLRRDLSVADDAFMPSRLAEDISNALNFDNGDLRNILKALNVETRTSSVEFDASAIWATEFHTSITDLHYELAMVAVDVTVEVVAKYSCWEGECATDFDILRLFNFCDPSVVARLSPTQVECLEGSYTLVNTATPPQTLDSGTIPLGGDVTIAAPPSSWSLQNTDGDTLASGTIPSNESALITAPDADVTINSATFASVPSGDTLDIPVVNGGSNAVGSEQGGEWVIGNSEVFINGVQVADIVSEDTANLAVELNGVLSGTWNAGTQTWEVTTPIPFTALTDSTQYPVTYIGWTDDGITYYITRITLSLNTATTAEAVGDWADRYTLIYT